jgi:predicted transposase YdaD
MSECSIEDILINYRTTLEGVRSLTPEEEELIMNLSAAYLKKQQEWKEEGRQEGRQELQVQAVMNGLREGVLPEMLAKMLGMSIKQVEALRDRYES